MLRGEVSTSRRRVRAFDAIFLVGLGGVFLVNGVIAMVHPEDFTGLIRDSAVWRWSRLGDPPWLGPVIGVNDLLLGIALCAAVWMRRHRELLLAWTGIWLLAVTVIKLTAMD
jgi:hypothetical protein